MPALDSDGISPRVGVGLSLGESAVEQPTCFPNGPMCSRRTLVPGVVYTGEIGVAFPIAAGALRFDGGAIVAWSPEMDGGNTASVGLGAGMSIMPFGRRRPGPAIRVRIGRLGHPLGATRWYGGLTFGLVW
jgi:hypothetical protein